jgi:hypothetical protein
LAKKYKKYKIKKEKAEPEQTSLSSRFTGKYAQSPRRERTPGQKKEYKKLALFLVGWIVLVASVYIACVQLEFAPILPIYTAAGVVLFLVWLVYNGGFKKIDGTKYEKPDDMGYDEFCRFIDKLKERQKKSKYFLILFIPFVVVMLADWWLIKTFPESDAESGRTHITDTVNHSDTNITDSLETENSDNN